MFQGITLSVNLKITRKQHFAYFGSFPPKRHYHKLGFNDIFKYSFIILCHHVKKNNKRRKECMLKLQ